MLKRIIITLAAILSVVGLAAPPADAHPGKDPTLFTYSEFKEVSQPAFTRVTARANAYWQDDGVGFNFSSLEVEMRQNYGCDLCVSVDTLKIIALPPSGPEQKWITHGPNLTHAYSFSCGTGGPYCERTWSLNSAGGIVVANSATAKVVLIGAVWNPNGPQNDFTLTVPICRTPTFGC